MHGRLRWKAATSDGSLPCCIWAVFGRRSTRCGRQLLRSGIMDDDRLQNAILRGIRQWIESVSRDDFRAELKGDDPKNYARRNELAFTIVRFIRHAEEREAK